MPPPIALSRTNKFILVTGVILVVYGYLCRSIPINFFWDSSTIGWILLLIALLLYWINLRRRRRQQNKKIVWVTIGIILLYLGLSILPVAIILIRNSDAYYAATEYLKNDLKIKTEVGNVKGFGLLPTGSVQVINHNGVQSGNATLAIIVEGNKKYLDVVIDLVKQPYGPWTVTGLRGKR